MLAQRRKRDEEGQGAEAAYPWTLFVPRGVVTHTTNAAELPARLRAAMLTETWVALPLLDAVAADPAASAPGPFSLEYVDTVATTRISLPAFQPGGRAGALELRLARPGSSGSDDRAGAAAAVLTRLLLADGVTADGYSRRAVLVKQAPSLYRPTLAPLRATCKPAAPIFAILGCVSTGERAPRVLALPLAPLGSFSDTLSAVLFEQQRERQHLAPLGAGEWDACFSLPCLRYHPFKA